MQSQGQSDARPAMVQRWRTDFGGQAKDSIQKVIIKRGYKLLLLYLHGGIVFQEKIHACDTKGEARRQWQVRVQRYRSPNRPCGCYVGPSHSC